MQCLRCGREIPAGDVFCQECLASMEKYPVKPDTPILLPKRQEPAAQKKQMPRRPVTPPEEQVKRLKRRLRIVSALLVLGIALGCVAAWLGYRYIQENRSKYLPGQNYSSSTSTAPNGTTEP